MQRAGSSEVSKGLRKRVGLELIVGALNIEPRPPQLGNLEVSFCRGVHSFLHWLVNQCLMPSSSGAKKRQDGGGLQ